MRERKNKKLLFNLLFQEKAKKVFPNKRRFFFTYFILSLRSVLQKNMFLLLSCLSALFSPFCTCSKKWSQVTFPRCFSLYFNVLCLKWWWLTGERKTSKKKHSKTPIPTSFHSKKIHYIYLSAVMIVSQSKSTTIPPPHTKKMNYYPGEVTTRVVLPLEKRNFPYPNQDMKPWSRLILRISIFKYYISQIIHRVLYTIAFSKNLSTPLLLPTIHIKTRLNHPVVCVFLGAKIISHTFPTFIKRKPSPQFSYSLFCAEKYIVFVQK